MDPKQKLANRKRMMSEAIQDNKKVPLLSQEVGGVNGNIDDIDFDQGYGADGSYHKSEDQGKHNTPPTHGSLDKNPG